MFIPLSQLLSTGRPDSYPFAFSDGELRSFGQFRNDVGCNLSRLQALAPAAPAGATRVVLFAEDSYLFCVGLLAILHAGFEVVLPENGQPGTLDKYRQGSLVLFTDMVSDDGQQRLLIQSDGAEGDATGFVPQVLNSETSVINFFTSGSSGEPKQIVKTLLALDREAALLEQYWGEQLAGATVLSTVTHQHLYGLTFKIFWSLCAGRPFLAQMFSYWEPLMAALREPMQRIACVISSPAHLTRYPPLTQLSESQQPVRVFCAGAALSTAGVESTRKNLGPIATEVYGSTETGVIAWRQQCEQDLAWAFFESIDGMVNSDGLLEVASPLVIGDDWFETSDRIELHDDGRFLLKGRADRVVKIEGKRVSLTAIEQYLSSVDSVEEAAVLVLADARGSLAAVLVLAPAAVAERLLLGDFRFSRRLRDLMRPLFDQAELPRRWRFVEQMPVNPQGKRTQKLLGELFDD